MSVPDPLPPAARTDLERLVRRWHELPSDRALAVVPEVIALAQRFADEAARLAGRSAVPLPDLHPASVPDALTVTAYDLVRADPARADAVTAALAALRRRVSAA